MSNISISRVAIRSPWRMPPVFLLPLRARMTTAAAHHAGRDPSPANTMSPMKPAQASATATPAQSPSVASSRTAATSHQQTQAAESAFASTAILTAAAAISAETSSTTATAPAPMSRSSNAAPLSESVRTMLPLLVSQLPHYATIHVHARAYLVTEGDVVRLPFKMPGVTPGDVLRLDRASLIGSRDFTLTGQPYVDDRLFECRAVVMSVEAEPMRFEEKTKRRNRRIKTVKSKHRYTEIAIKELRVKDLSEVER